MNLNPFDLVEDAEVVEEKTIEEMKSEEESKEQVDVSNPIDEALKDFDETKKAEAIAKLAAAEEYVAENLERVTLLLKERTQYEYEEVQMDFQDERYKNYIEVMPLLYAANIRGLVDDEVYKRLQDTRTGIFHVELFAHTIAKYKPEELAEITNQLDVALYEAVRNMATLQLENSLRQLSLEHANGSLTKEVFDDIASVRANIYKVHSDYMVFNEIKDGVLDEIYAVVNKVADAYIPYLVESSPKVTE